MARLKIIIALAIAAIAASGSSAIAQTGSAQSKSSLINEINTNFPSQNVGEITPTIMRQGLLDLLASSQQYTGVNAQSGTSYTIQTSDYGQLVTFNNSSPVAVTLPQGTSGNGFSPFNVLLSNIGTGTVTITPTTSTINGAASLDLAAGESTWIVSDGTNYKTSITALAPSGNTGTAATVSGNLVQGDCLVPDSHKNIVDLGSPCVAATSGVGAGTTNQMPFYKTSGSVVSATSTLPLGMDLTGGQATHDQQPNGGAPVWNRLGTAISPTSPNCSGNGFLVAERGMLYEGNPKILTSATNVFKAWFSMSVSTGDGAGGYAESTDGVNWTCYSGNPVVPHGANEFHSVVKSGGVYILFPINSSTTCIDRWESSDGITGWTKTHANILCPLANPNWENGALANAFVWQEGPTTWHMMYAGRSGGTCSSFNFAEGLANSSDGITWTRSGSNPVATQLCPSGAYVYKAQSGTYYMWSQITGGDPTISDIGLFTSTNLTSWTLLPGCVLCRGTLDEGVGDISGQAADPSLIQVGNQTFMYYAVQNAASGGSQKIKAAVANMPIEQLITSKQGYFPEYFFGAGAGNPLQLGAGPNGEHINFQYGSTFGTACFNASYGIAGALTTNVASEPGECERWAQATSNSGAQWSHFFINAAGAQKFIIGADMTSGGSVNNTYISGTNLCLGGATFGTCGDLIAALGGAFRFGSNSDERLLFGSGQIKETASFAPGAGNAGLWDDSTSHRPMFNYNGGNNLTLPGAVAQGTSSVGGNSITAGTCDTVVTTAASNAATTDSISWAFNAAPGSNWPFVTVQAYLTSGNVNFLVCNPGAANKTPAAATLNWSVIR